MANFNGTLRSNEIFASIYNMIISQQVFTDNITHNYALVDKAKVDGTLYGDTKLYYSADVLHSEEWGKDGATNILELHRPKAPQCQAIHLDKFRQIALTVDNYLTKRAWSTEGAFTSFNSVMLSMIRETKRIYEVTLYNTFIGTAKGQTPAQNIEWAISDVVGNETGLEAARLEATEIGRKLADLIVDLKDYSRDFNDYGNLRSYSMEKIIVIWNAEIYNKIRKVDLPTIFHKEGIIDKFDSYVLPAKYFGEVNNSGASAPSANTNVRSRVEKDFEGVHLFPGDLLPNDAAYAEGETYTQDSDVICKIFVKLPPIMSSFEVGTSFFNPRSLTENHYLTWGYNTLEYLKNYPCITIHKD